MFRSSVLRCSIRRNHASLRKQTTDQRSRFVSRTRASMAATDKPVIKVDVWSDIACPWCYVGYKRLEKAIQAISPTATVQATWHAFLLDPSYHFKHPMGESVNEYISNKFGIADADAMKQRVIQSGSPDGATFKSFDIRANTLPGHRLIALARKHGKSAEAEAVIFRMNYEDGLNVSDPEVLKKAGKEIGLDAADVEDYVEGRGGLEAVEADLQEARRRRITGVPAFFVSSGDSAAAVHLSGAQPVEVFKGLFEEVLDKAAQGA